MTADKPSPLAWALHVELATRVATVPLAPGRGRVRDALRSLHATLEATGEPLRVGGESGRLARQAREALEPFIERWDRELTRHEAARDPAVGALAHERAWPAAPVFHAELAALQRRLRDIADGLADAAGAGSLVALADRRGGRG